MKSIYVFAIIILCSALFGACSTTKQFDFKTAYKFSQYDYSKKVAQLPPKEHQLTATTSPSLSFSTVRPMLPGPVVEEYVRPTKKKLSRAELKSVRKALKKEIKRLDEEITSLEQQKMLVPELERAKYERTIVEKKVQRKEAKAMNHKIFLGILFAAAGIVLLIVGVVEWLGALALVLGLVFIIWGFIQKGSF